MQFFIKNHILTLGLCLSLIACTADDSKINGVSFVASDKPITAEVFEPIQAINANWVAIMPYGYGNIDDTHLQFDIGWQWWGEHTKGALKTIELAKQAEQKIMIKPHVWFRGGGYTGDYNAQDKWPQWEADFTKYIMHWAQLSEQHQVDLFCIATEMDMHIQARPEYWNTLIDSVRKVYNGPITYASNWDECGRVPFWSRLDYIGVDAYFPLSHTQHPPLGEIKDAWLKHKTLLSLLHEKHQKLILFTEYGYCSRDYALKEPWVDRSDEPVNEQLQADAYQAIFESFWSEPWFEGGFLWKWYYNKSFIHEAKNSFTPQYKKAKQTIKRYYGK